MKSSLTDSILIENYEKNYKGENRLFSSLKYWFKLATLKTLSQHHWLEKVIDSMFTGVHYSDPLMKSRSMKKVKHLIWSLLLSKLGDLSLLKYSTIGLISYLKWKQAFSSQKRAPPSTSNYSMSLFFRISIKGKVLYDLFN